RVTLNLEVLPGRIVAVGKFWTPDPETLPFPFEVAENRVRIVLDAGEVRIPGFALHTISVPWSGFELGSDETSEVTCAEHGESTLDSFEGSYDPATGAVTGTGVV
ncbi:MAG: hypothetical protein GWN07_01870, partial [Actinobacteria bacterium]|nr:hypothetical protein [Actinomycetota bacterium]NIU64274.1 hypothetical protein [Actinomycetota bacterium]NIW26081.1 hypothetical protein [Actinomycetota bacterium]NIX18653.1 hypothetical protein [Actinomycetota bacterium]